jgi:DNA-directed RNA polymerase subunit RPC12/RpoP
VDAQEAMNGPQQPYRIPTVYGQACPHCGSRDVWVKKVKGGFAMAVKPTQLCSNTIAELAQKHDSVFEKALNPLIYRCHSCKKDFESLPVAAPATELLDRPCTVHFTRTFNFRGSAMPFYVFINGICILPVRTGSSITFQTPIRHNTVFVTDGLSMRQFGKTWSYEASGGEEVFLRYSNKFKSASAGGFEPTSGFSAYTDAGRVAEAEGAYQKVKKSKRGPLQFWVLLIIELMLLVAVIAVPSWCAMREVSRAGRQWQEDAGQLRQTAPPSYDAPTPTVPDSVKPYVEDGGGG